MTDTELNGVMLMVGWLTSYLVVGWLSFRYSRRFFHWILPIASRRLFGGEFFRVSLPPIDGQPEETIRVWAKDPQEAVKKAVLKEKEADDASKKD